MLRALVDLGKRLEAEEKLPPVGFYDYGQPIRWIVHVKSDPGWAEITAVEIEVPRPFSGRTGRSTIPHPVADEAAYALGVKTKATGELDDLAAKKHGVFLEQLEEAAEHVQSDDVKQGLTWTREVLERGTVQGHPRFEEITAKDWVSFLLEEGPLRGTHLFEHDELKEFWVVKAQMNVAQRDKLGNPIVGECSICGEEKPLIRMIPLNAKLNKTTPIHSLNENAYVSFTTSKDTHIGLCFECADTATRAFNYLSDKNAQIHRRAIIRDKQSSDSLKNQVALFWLNPKPSVSSKDAEDIQAGEMTLNVSDMAVAFGQALVETRAREETDTPVPDLVQLQELVKLPWKPRDASLKLSDYGFYLAVLSPNVGRIALREWVDVSLDVFKRNFARYLDALSIVLPSGRGTRAVSISTIYSALTPPASRSVASNPAVLRGLLRCAYQGFPPPPGILNMAVQRFRVPETHEEAWRVHALAAAMKLVLTHHDEKEARRMQEVDEGARSTAYLYGRQLAVVERAQEYSQWLDDRRRGQPRSEEGKGTNVMLIERYYGGASSTPGTVMPQLYRLFETAYLPKIRRERRGTYEWLRSLMTEVSEMLNRFPPQERQRALSPQEQAEFALGFYSQRAHFRKRNTQDESNDQEQGVEA